MSALAFFHPRGEVGTSTLVQHLAHAFAELGRPVLLLDLDPQCTLTELCLPDLDVAPLWREPTDSPRTLAGALRGALGGGGPLVAPTMEVAERVRLLPGDVAAGGFEDALAAAWSRAEPGDGAGLSALAAVHRLIAAARDPELPGELVLMDLGAHPGALARAGLLAADGLVSPVAPGEASLRALRSLGPTITAWREGWRLRRARCPAPPPGLPEGAIRPLGYVVMQSGMRLSRPSREYPRGAGAIPTVYAEALVGGPPASADAAHDPACIGEMRRYLTLMPLAQDAQVPMSRLRPAHGAIGPRMAEVHRCADDLRRLADALLRRLERDDAPRPTPIS
jgi:chromosome partitioning protein